MVGEIERDSEMAFEMLFRGPPVVVDVTGSGVVWFEWLSFVVGCFGFLQAVVVFVGGCSLVDGTWSVIDDLLIARDCLAVVRALK